MSNLRSFAPWIAFSLVSAFVDWRIAAAVALVLAVLAVRAEGRENLLSIATAWFFGGLTVLSWTDPTSALHRYTPALALLALGVASALSLVRRRPFTEVFARRVTPPEVWEKPQFRQANMTITAVWTASFLVTGAACAALLAAAPHSALWLAAQVVGFVVPMRFTKIYRARLQARRAQLAMA